MKKLFMVLLGVLIILSGCDIFKAVEYTTNFTINGVVKDGSTGELVANADILWTSFNNANGVEKSTTAAGVFNVSGAENGDYILRATYTDDETITTDSDYTVAQAEVEIDGTSVLISSMGITDYRSTENVEMIIYPLTATASFEIILQDNDFSSNTTYDDLTVYAQLLDEDGNVDPNNDEYLGIVASGDASFTGLPAAPKVKIVIGGYVDTYGNVYNASTVDTYDFTGVTPQIPKQTLSPSSGTIPTIVSHNMDDNFAVDGTISMTFSKAIDPDNSSFVLGSIPLEAVWDADYKGVTFTPDMELSIATTYTLTYTLVSTDGFSGTVDSTLSLTTVPGIKYVSSNILDADYNSNRLAITSNLIVTFSQTIDRVENVLLYYNIATPATTVDIDHSVSGATLTINPAGDLNYDESYILYVDVYGTAEDATDSISFDDTSTPTLAFTTVKEAYSAPTLSAPTNLTTIGGPYDYDATDVTIEFQENAESEEVDGYYAYARIANSGTDWIKVGSTLTGYVDYIPNQGALTTSITAYLTDNSGETEYASYFDYYTDDAIYTPFAAGQEVEFKIMAYKDTPEGTIYGTEALLTSDVGDTQAPTITVGGYGNWVEATAPAAAFNFTAVTGSEYITRPQTFTLSADLVAGGASVTTTQWTAAPTVFTITYNPNSVTLANTSYIRFTATDSSGNSNTYYIGFTLSGVAEIRLTEISTTP